MATLYEEYISTHYGLEQQGARFGYLHRATSEAQWKKLPSNWLSAMYGKVNLCPGFMNPYVAALYSETKDNSSTIALAANGLTLATQASPSANDDVAINGLMTHTLAAGKWVNFGALIQKSDLDDIGLRLGLVTSGGTEHFTAAPTDGLYFATAANAGTCTGNTTENGAAAAASATLHTFVDATFVLLECVCYIGSTEAATVGAWYVDGVETAFSAAQITDLYTIVATTAPTVCFHVGGRVAGTTQRNLKVAFAYCFIDR